MVICPKCGNRIPSRKLMLLTNHNTIACPTCSAKLHVKNKNFGRLVGASGGATGTVLFLSLYYWLRLRELFFVVLFVAFLSLFAVVVLAWVKFLKLEVKS